MSEATIWDTLTQRLKDAMKARDTKTTDVIRLVRSRIQAKTKEPGFKGEINDDLCVAIITTYVKQMTKAIAEYKKAGERGAEEVDRLQFEVDFLQPFLPQKLDEAATRTLVEAKIAELGVTGSKNVGRVMGTIMKGHKDEVDAGLVRRIVGELLSD